MVNRDAWLMEKRPITINLVDGAGHRRKDTRTIKKQVKAIVKMVQEEEWRLEEHKPFMVSFREHIGRMIDKLDPLKLAAILSLTYFNYGYVAPTVAKLLGIQAKDIQNEVAQFGISFLCSYLIIENFGKIIEGATKIAVGVEDIIKWFIIGKSFGSGATGAGALSGFGLASTSFWLNPVGLISLVPTKEGIPFGQALIEGKKPLSIATRGRYTE